MSNRIIIYGAGMFGKYLYAFLNGNGIQIDAFCQTEKPEHIDNIEGTKIISINELQMLDEPTIILIAIADETISSGIKIKLTNMFLDKVRVLECGNFILQNLQNYESGRHCLICGSDIGIFDAYGINNKIFYKNHIIGGGYRENCRCPICGSLDRNRWLLWVLSKHTQIFVEKCAVLHFAPEDVLVQRIKNNEQCDYYSCDIVQGKAMHVVDVTDIQFQDGFFDYIIINHVLEHIIDEAKAISELKRVLKTGGKIVLSFPICTDQKTFQDCTITTADERLAAYGQEDHVRLYGNDYKEYLEQYGLRISIHSPQNECSEKDILKYGFISDDVIMICEV